MHQIEGKTPERDQVWSGGQIRSWENSVQISVKSVKDWMTKNEYIL